MKRSLIFGLAGLLCLTHAHAEQPPSKETIAYVQKLQTAEGGFLPAASASKSFLRATVAAIRALRYFGGELPDKGKCAEFLAACHDKASGGFADNPKGKPDVFSTAIGLMGVVELKMSKDNYQPPGLKYLCDHCQTFDEIRIAAAAVESIKQRPSCTDEWLRQIARLRNSEGDYGKGPEQARVTADAVVTLLRLGAKLDHEGRIFHTLRAGQRPDGAFGKVSSDLETTYRVMRAYHMLKGMPGNPDAVRAFVGKCRNTDGGYGVTPGQPSNVAGTYYAGIILHWLDDRR